MSRRAVRVSQHAVKSRFERCWEGKTEILIAPHFLEWLQQAGIERVGEVIDKAEIDPGRGGRLGLRVFCPDGLQEHRCIVRHYTHGGLLRRVLGDRFLLSSRPFREMRITEEIRDRGLPTVEVLAALRHPVWGLFCRGELITREIPETSDLASFLLTLGTTASAEEIALRRKTLIEAGRTVKRMHDLGIYHQDLNLKNLLVQPGDQGDPRVYIIDFDRSKRLKSLSNTRRMRNLLRLNRSAEKWKTKGAPITYTDKARFFQAYAGDDAGIIRAMKRRLRRHGIRAFWSHIGWSADRLLNPSHD
jgi:tRNA A-37 threonylcarbamoyl transferase component Bud32